MPKLGPLLRLLHTDAADQVQPAARAGGCDIGEAAELQRLAFDS